MTLENQRVKYPRTPHLPSSPGCTSDDKRMEDTSVFDGKVIVVTEKMDGENTTLYGDGFHARSIDTGAHPSRDWLKAFHATIAWRIPQGTRICGENLYAQHAIRYDDLPSYFMGFSAWKGPDCLDWQETTALFDDLGVSCVPVLYQGPFDAGLLDDLIKGLDPSRQEGLVVRLAGSFELSDFQASVAKWVRPGHVQTDTHWTKAPLVANGIARTDKDGATLQ